jgi:ADP-ribose pyrophosphatase YjhB (NUDIX family)
VDASAEHPPGWLPVEEYRAIFKQVTRACVELVIVEPGRGALLSLRDHPPFEGSWHIPGGTILWGERVLEAVKRVAARELGLAVEVGELLGYIEYPSHTAAGIDSPVGLAFACSLTYPDAQLPPGCAWFTTLPAGLYAEQREFLVAHFGLMAG